MAEFGSCNRTRTPVTLQHKHLKHAINKEILTNLNEVMQCCKERWAKTLPEQCKTWIMSCRKQLLHAGKNGSNYWIMREHIFSTGVHEATNLCTGWIYYNKAYNSWNALNCTRETGLKAQSFNLNNTSLLLFLNWFYVKYIFWIDIHGFNFTVLT